MRNSKNTLYSLPFFLRVVFIGLLLLWFPSCTKIEGIGPSPVSLDAQGYVEIPVTDTGGKYTLYVAARKAWMDKEDTQIEFKIDDRLLQDFNKETSKDLSPLPSSLITIAQSSYTLSGKELSALCKIDIDLDQYKKTIAKYETAAYAVGVRLYVNGKPLEEKGTQAIYALNIKPASISLTIAEETITVNDEEDFLITIPYQLNFKNPYTIRLHPSYSADLVAKYNEAHQTSYAAFKAADIEPLAPEELVIDRGKTNGRISFVAKRSGISEDPSKIPSITILPITFSKVQSSGYIDQPLPTIGLDPEHDVYYCKFVYLPEVFLDPALMTISSNRNGRYDLSSLISEADSGKWWNTAVSTGADPLYLDIAIEKQATLYGVQITVESTQRFGLKGPKQCKIYTSQDGTNWEFVETYNFSGGYDPQKFVFPTDQGIRASFLRIAITDCDRGNAYRKIRPIGTVVE